MCSHYLCRQRHITTHLKGVHWFNEYFLWDHYWCILWDSLSSWDNDNLDSLSTQVRAMSGMNPGYILNTSDVLVRKIQHYLKLLLKTVLWGFFSSNITTVKILICWEFRGAIASNPLVTTDKYFAKFLGQRKIGIFGRWVLILGNVRCLSWLTWKIKFLSCKVKSVN